MSETVTSEHDAPQVGEPSFPDGRSQQAALDAHVRDENAHDLDAIMAGFGPTAVLEMNGEPFDDLASIRLLHEQSGFSGVGALSDLTVTEHRRSFTDDGIVVEGRITGRHTGPFVGREPSGKEIVIPYCVIYQFGEDGLLYSERAYMDFLPFAG